MFVLAIHYASRTLNSAERNYSTIERELLAIIYAVAKFRYYLYGKKFTIITDHNPLIYLNNITLSSDRLTRWRLKLTEYDFDIVYRKGKANANADAMSRVEGTEENGQVNDSLDTLFAINEQEYITKQEILESISSIQKVENKLRYSDKNIFECDTEETVVVCIPSKIKSINGLAKQIIDSYEVNSRLKRHKLKVGKSIALESKRTILFMVTKKINTSKPSYDILNSC